jgi:hypothetical protein
MYRSPTSALPDGHDSSEVVHDFARRLRVQADIIDSVLQQLRTADNVGWESPGGRNFRSYLGDRTAALAGTTALLREASVSMDAYGRALRLDEAGSGLQP